MPTTRSLTEVCQVVLIFYTAACQNNKDNNTVYCVRVLLFVHTNCSNNSIYAWEIYSNIYYHKQRGIKNLKRKLQILILRTKAHFPFEKYMPGGRINSK